MNDERKQRQERLLEAILPPPMPTAMSVIEQLDNDDIRVTVRAVNERLVQLRGFDASTKEVSEAIADYRDFQRQLAELAFDRGWHGLTDCAGPGASRSRMLRDMVAKMWSQAATARKEQGR
jgi:hypothetical protein